MSGLITVALTAADVLRLVSALADYRRRVKRTLPAEQSVPDGIDDLTMRLRTSMDTMLRVVDAPSKEAP